MIPVCPQVEDMTRRKSRSDTRSDARTCATFPPHQGRSLCYATLHTRDDTQRARLRRLGERGMQMDDTSTSTAFGALLRHHRHAAGMTQAELAERAGLSVRGISDLERGARRAPYQETVARLADALCLANDERVAFQAAARRGVRHSSGCLVRQARRRCIPRCPRHVTLPTTCPSRPRRCWAVSVR